MIIDENNNLKKLQELTDRLFNKEQEILILGEKLRSIVNATGIGTWEWDVKKGTLEWNANMFRIFGVDRATFRGTYDDFSKCLHPEDKERIDTILATCAINKKQYSVKYRVVWPNGIIRHIVAEAAFISEDIMFGICMDITDKIKEN